MAYRIQVERFCTNNYDKDNDWEFYGTHFSEITLNGFIEQNLRYEYTDSDGKTHDYIYRIIVHVISSAEFSDRERYSVPIKEFTFINIHQH